MVSSELYGIWSIETWHVYVVVVQFSDTDLWLVPNCTEYGQSRHVYVVVVHRFSDTDLWLVPNCTEYGQSRHDMFMKLLFNFQILIYGNMVNRDMTCLCSCCSIFRYWFMVSSELYGIWSIVCVYVYVKKQ
jgi:hypothetical protein